jgi:hypothetical protein
MYHAKFELDILPHTTNALSRMHWRAKSKYANTVKNLVHSKLLLLHLIPRDPLKKAKLILTRKSSGTIDYDGLVSSFKWVIDGLVVAGVLMDDTEEIIGQPVYRKETAAPKNGSIEIEIIEL